MTTDKSDRGAISPQLDHEDEFILNNPISPRRRETFIEDFRDSRRETRILERLFAISDRLSFVTAEPPPDVVPVGFNVLLPKGPFVDGSNWLSIRGWDFAVQLELHLLGRFETALRQATGNTMGDMVNREALQILEAASELESSIATRSKRPPNILFVLTGPLGSQLYVDLVKSGQIRGDWEQDVRSTLGTTFRVLGTFAGSPILDIPASDLPALYAVNMSRFGRLLRYGPDPDVQIDPIDAAQADEIIDRNPNVVPTPPEGVDARKWRILQAQLRVWLRVNERYKLTVDNTDAVRARPLVGPVLEYR